MFFIHSAFQTDYRAAYALLKNATETMYPFCIKGTKIADMLPPLSSLIKPTTLDLTKNNMHQYYSLDNSKAEGDDDDQHAGQRSLGTGHQLGRDEKP